MIRSLYTAATGMKSQDLNVSVIANNLANVNTTGFKRSPPEFQDLIYQNLRLVGTLSPNGNQVPTGAQLGLGVKTAAIQKVFLQKMKLLVRSMLTRKFLKSLLGIILLLKIIIPAKILKIILLKKYL